MNFFVDENERKASNSTCYLEFQEGKGSDTCWLETSINIDDDIWDEYEMSKLMYSANINFDFYGITVINKEQWAAVVEKSKGSIAECIVKDAVPWVEKCFKNNDFFTIIGL